MNQAEDYTIMCYFRYAYYNIHVGKDICLILQSSHQTQINISQAQTYSRRADMAPAQQCHSWERDSYALSELLQVG